MSSSDNKNILSRIRSVIEVTAFDPPAAQKLMAEVERDLDVLVPEWLRPIYLACDGFRGPTGVRYVYPLSGHNGVLVFNLFLRDEEWSPSWLKRAIVFGDNGVGGTLTVHWADLDGKLIEWCLGDGAEFTTLEDGLFVLWQCEQELWSSLDGA